MNAVYCSIFYILVTVNYFKSLVIKQTLSKSCVKHQGSPTFNLTSEFFVSYVIV